MALYTIKGNQLLPIKEEKIKLEKHLQAMAEANLDEIFGLQFISTEFEHNNLRIDTLAYDPEANAFVIIEYKRDRSFSVIDQGYAYLSLLLNNKAEFILEYNEKTGKQLQRNSVDWSQSRVVFVANSFTLHQQQAINFKDLPIEIWEAKQYDNGTILFNELKAQDTSESIKTVSKNHTIQKVSSEVKVYNISDHFAGAKSGSFEMYQLFRDKLQNMEPRIQENIRSKYIGMSLAENGNDTLVYIHPQASQLRLDIPRIRPADINDPLGRLTYKEHSFERMNTPVSFIAVKDEEEAEYAISLLRQVRQKFFK